MRADFYYKFYNETTIEHPETDMSQPEIKPWPPAAQAGILPKSYLDSLLLPFRNRNKTSHLKIFKVKVVLLIIYHNYS
jgi:hypothetical protein